MYETTVTVVGHVATEPHRRVTRSGVRVVSFRLATTERRFDPKVRGWRDGDTLFWTVTCWRNIADNVTDSLHKGDPVVVFGRIKDGSYEGRDGVRRTVYEIEATNLGHDVSRGVSRFTRASVVPGERDLMPDVEDDDLVVDDDLDADDDEADEQARELAEAGPADGPGLGGAADLTRSTSAA